MDKINIYQPDENIETIMDVEYPEDHDKLLYKDYDNISESYSPYEYSHYSLKDESLVIIEDDDSNSNDTYSENMAIKVRNKLNRSTSAGTTEQHTDFDKIEDNADEIEISDQQVPIKACGMTSITVNSQINEKKKDYQSLEKLVPKTIMSNIKLNPPVISNPIKKLPSISIASANIKPATKVTMLHSKSHTSFPKSKQGIYVIPPSKLNYVIRKRDSLESLPESINQNTNSIVSTPKSLLSNETKRVSKFVARMQKLPGGKFRVLSGEGKVPCNLDNLLKRNSHFIKHKMAQSYFSNQDAANKNFTNVKNSSLYSHVVQQNRQVSGNSLKNISKNIDFGNRSRNNKFAPHTVTSKNLIENHKNITIENGEIKLKTYGKPDVSASTSGFIQLVPKSKSMIQSDNQSLSVTRYGKIAKNDRIAVEVVSLDSINKQKTKLANNNKWGGKNISTNTFYRNKVLSEEMKNIEEKSEFSDEGDNESSKFISCHYAYCDTLVYEPELVDELYCSRTCKRLNSNIIVKDEKPVVEELKNPPAKPPIIDRKKLLAKLENRINKRKQMLTTACPEKIARTEDWDDLEQFENSCNEQPTIELNSPTHSFGQTNIPEDDGDLLIFDLKSEIDDKKLLSYMEKMQFNSAPKKLFEKPFPTDKNNFQKGQKLEGIDPEHEALFCVMTIEDICGYRIKLHFDGYPNGHDFWVNADCPDLFYPKWCEQNGRILQPPKHYNKQFDWNVYIKECRVVDNQVLPAPKWNFASTTNLINGKTQTKFCIGAKLEALDKLTRTLPKQLICVATVADVLGDRIRIHFDGWTDDFDYWTDITSTNIHPIRWCDNNGRSLSPPSGYNDYKGKKPFLWTEYLSETNSVPVPENAFVRRPLRDFSINMTVEVVDLVNPSLIRIAKVVDVRGDELKILYDGFHNMYAYWVEDDSPDIHPIGWSLKTNHPIEIPRGKDIVWSCNIEGCNGKGNINIYIDNHIFAKDCPYELDAWKKSVAGLAKLPDRLKTIGLSGPIVISSKSQSTDACKIKPKTYENFDEEKKENNKLNTTVPRIVTNNPPKYIGNINNNKSNEQSVVNNIGSIQSTEINSVLVKQNTAIADINRLEIKSKKKKHIEKDILGFPSYDMNPFTLPKRGLTWTRHIAKIDMPVFNTGDVRKWSVEEVASYVDELISTQHSNSNHCERTCVSNRFIEENINGDTFLMLTQDELMRIFKVPLGVALKITSAIIMLRQRVPVFDL